MSGYTKEQIEQDQEQQRQRSINAFAAGIGDAVDAYLGRRGPTPKERFRRMMARPRDPYHWNGIQLIAHTFPNQRSSLMYEISDRTLKIEIHCSQNVIPFQTIREHTEIVFNREGPVNCDIRVFSFFYEDIMRYMSTSPNEIQRDWLPLLERFNPRPPPIIDNLWNQIVNDEREERENI